MKAYLFSKYMGYKLSAWLEYDKSMEPYISSTNSPRRRRRCCGSTDISVISNPYELLKWASIQHREAMQLTNHTTTMPTMVWSINSYHNKYEICALYIMASSWVVRRHDGTAGRDFDQICNARSCLQQGQTVQSLRQRREPSYALYSNASDHQTCQVSVSLKNFRTSGASILHACE